MANETDNIFMAGNGAIAHAPLGSTCPTDYDETLAAAFVAVGYVSEDGVTEKIDTDSKKIKAWQNGDTVRTRQTSHAMQYEFTMIERNDESVAMFYGNGTSSSIEINGAELPHEAYVIDALDGENVIRIVIPDGQVVERKEVSYKNDDVVAFGVVIEAYPDENGDKAFIYSGTLQES